jgi:hypothetical protein
MSENYFTAISGIFDQSPLHGILVYVAQLFFALALLPRLEERETWGTPLAAIATEGHKVGLLGLLETSQIARHGNTLYASGFTAQ